MAVDSSAPSSVCGTAIEIKTSDECAGSKHTNIDQPIPIPELTKLTTDACDNALKSITEYDHTAVPEWNSQIINAILQALIAASSPTDTTKPQPYRFIVNSTIVQQGVIDKSAAADGTQGNAGKRGMHHAAVAFWDAKKDGMWTFKYTGAEEQGLDVVISVTWFSVV